MKTKISWLLFLLFIWQVFCNFYELECGGVASTVFGFKALLHAWLPSLLGASITLYWLFFKSRDDSENYLTSEFLDFTDLGERRWIKVQFFTLLATTLLSTCSLGLPTDPANGIYAFHGGEYQEKTFGVLHNPFWMDFRLRQTKPRQSLNREFLYKVGEAEYLILVKADFLIFTDREKFVDDIIIGKQGNFDEKIRELEEEIFNHALKSFFSPPSPADLKDQIPKSADTILSGLGYIALTPGSCVAN